MDSEATEVNSGGEPAGERLREPRFPSPARERQRQVREEVILEAARILIVSVGYNAMTMDDLAAEAGISKPTLYHHFPSKEAVAVRAIVALMEQGLATVHAMDPALPAIAKIEYLVRHFVYRKFVQRCTSFGSARAALVPVVRSSEDYQRVYNALIEAFLEIMDAAKTEGTIDPEFSSRIVVQTLFSILRDWEYEELIDSGECRPEEVAETLIALLLRGMRRTVSDVSEIAATPQP